MAAGRKTGGRVGCNSHDRRGPSQASLQPVPRTTDTAYMDKISEDCDIRTALFDGEGEPSAIGSEMTLRQLAVTNRFVNVSRL